MSPRAFRIAVPTKRKGGLKAAVSEVFSRSETFTIVDIDEEGMIRDVKVIDNPAASYKHGAGPIAIKMLADLGVNVAVAAELGIGASTLLSERGIKAVRVRAGTSVPEAVRKALSEARRRE